MVGTLELPPYFLVNMKHPHPHSMIGVDRLRIVVVTTKLLARHEARTVLTYLVEFRPGNKIVRDPPNYHQSILQVTLFARSLC